MVLSVFVHPGRVISLQDCLVPQTPRGGEKQKLHPSQHQVTPFHTFTHPQQFGTTRLKKKKKDRAEV